MVEYQANTVIWGCHYLVTCDDRLMRQVERLREKGVLTPRVINPIDLLREV